MRYILWLNKKRKKKVIYNKAMRVSPYERVKDDLVDSGGGLCVISANALNNINKFTW
jgi:hypothetical protein